VNGLILPAKQERVFVVLYIRLRMDEAKLIEIQIDIPELFHKTESVAGLSDNHQIIENVQFDRKIQRIRTHLQQIVTGISDGFPKQPVQLHFLLLRLQFGHQLVIRKIDLVEGSQRPCKRLVVPV
jgi:hypothetical protein